MNLILHEVGVSLGSPNVGNLASVLGSPCCSQLVFVLVTCLEVFFVSDLYTLDQLRHSELSQVVRFTLETPSAVIDHCPFGILEVALQEGSLKVTHDFLVNFA